VSRPPATPGGKGRFPGFDVVGQAGHWDAETRGVVLGRLAPPSPVSFLDRQEEATARALLDRLLAQDDDPKVPVLEQIDARLRSGDGDGYRYEGMPPDGEAWKRSLAGLDRDSDLVHGKPFPEIAVHYQKDVVEAVRRAPGDWHGMPAKRVFQLWMRYALSAFYAHPWAWNEIGFPGPAYPRGYKTFGVDVLEPFEVREREPRDPAPWLERVRRAREEHGDRGDDGHGPHGPGGA